MYLCVFVRSLPHNFKWKIHGRVKEIGVHANDPRTEMNLSKAFPREMQNKTVKPTIKVRLKFLSHILFFDLGIPLKI